MRDSQIFLEAWATGVPVISLNVNPGEVFTRYELVHTVTAI
jgi:hypothetical protein